MIGFTRSGLILHIGMYVSTQTLTSPAQLGLFPLQQMHLQDKG